MDQIDQFPFTAEQLLMIEDAKKKARETRLREEAEDKQNGHIRMTSNQAKAALLARSNPEGISAATLRYHLGGELATWLGALKKLLAKGLFVVRQESTDAAEQLYRAHDVADLDKQIECHNLRRKADLIKMGYDPSEVPDFTIDS